jgi:hypothetical protein
LHYFQARSLEFVDWKRWVSRLRGKVLDKVKIFQPIKAVPVATPLEVHFPTPKSYSTHVDGSKFKGSEV